MVDHNLFLTLNFDGGAFMDALMLIVSGKLFGLPFYVLMIYLIYKREGWRNLLLFLGLALLGVVLTDMVAGIFKHTGLLGDLFPNLEPRLRPMHTPELLPLIHVVKQGGLYGTVSAHAATTMSVAWLSGSIVRRSWYGWLMAVWTLLVCYSRIYLAYHFPLDILYGLLLGWVLASLGWLIYRRFRFSTEQ